MSKAVRAYFLTTDDGPSLPVAYQSYESLTDLRNAPPADCRLTLIDGDSLSANSETIGALQALRKHCALIIVGRDAPIGLRGCADIATGELSDATLPDLVAEARERWAFANRQCEQAMADAVGRVAGGISHDLNNILMIIMGPLEMAITTAANTPLEDLINMGLDATGTATDMTRRLGSFSTRSSEASRLELGRFVANTEKGMRDRLDEHADFTVTNRAGELPVRVCAQRLTRVIATLVDNARDATAAGGNIELECSDEPIATEGPGRRLLTQRAPARYGVVTVRDSGEGMDARILANAGEFFFTTRERGYTAGLGLALARAYLESEGHGLVIESQAGKGTAAHCLIALAQAPAAEIPPAADGAA